MTSILRAISVVKVLQLHFVVPTIISSSTELSINASYDNTLAISRRNPTIAFFRSYYYSPFSMLYQALQKVLIPTITITVRKLSDNTRAEKNARNDDYRRKLCLGGRINLANTQVRHALHS